MSNPRMEAAEATPEELPVSILRLRFCRDLKTGDRIDTGKERAVCFESPGLPTSWRLWRRPPTGRWLPGPNWHWMDEEGET